ncbi:MAG: DUF4268 domain-containing protein [Oscillochloris sp.]|nr:DUF4268 domain-containing protein [Oscillochloris sp.]
MPFLIKDLIEGRPRPLACAVDAPAQDALAMMIEHDYSQLPVVDATNHPLGMVSSDSLLRALHYFGITLQKLRVSHGLIKTSKYHPEDDLFELLDALRDSYAALIVDSDECLVGIVTSYDATEYFRRRSEDVMLVEDVETTIREYILAAFTDASGDLKRDDLDAFVTETLSDNRDLRTRFSKAIATYTAGDQTGKPQVDQARLNEAFKQFAAKGQQRAFEDLTLANYVALLTRKDRWDFYAPTFGLEPSALFSVLDEVRKIRNGLAHFRGEISTRQRDLLRFCSDWLARHQPTMPTTVALVATSITAGAPILDQPILGTSVTTQAANSGSAHGVVHDSIALSEAPQPPDAEEGQSSDSRYVPLARFLQSQPSDADAVELSFAAIEEIIGEQLPASARRHRSMWANDPISRPQARQWLNAGWRVSGANLDAERIVFTRNKEHERAYLTFFAALQAELEQAAPGMFQFMPSNGRYYLGLGTVSIPTKNIASFFCSFTRTKRFRVELVIDIRDEHTTKQIFDALADRKAQIEDEIGEKLSWERMEDNRPSRIARYYSGTIKDTTGALSNLRARAVEAARRFVPVLRTHMAEVVPGVLGAPVVDTAAEPRP